MDKNRLIKADGLLNARDLGGLKTTDNKTIVRKRLLRSEALSGISDKDKEMLAKDYGLHTVIDMRMDMEIAPEPDKEIEGVKTVFIPLLDSSFLGIARDEYSVEAWLNMFRGEGAEPAEIFREMYLKIAFSERNIPLFRTFFDELLANESGSVLWHCSAGKDRAGISAALILGALGVPREDIVEDYHLTQICTRRKILKVKLLSPLKGYTGKLHKAIVILFSAEKEYIGWVLDEIDKRYGSVPEYLKQHIGVTEEEIAQLRKMYLE